MNPATLCLHGIPSQHLNTQRGGNLARVTHASSSQEGHFLFCEPRTAAPHPSVSYALNNRFDPVALSANAFEKTPYTDELRSLSL